MITQIRHTGLVVNDLEGMMHFWCDLLGFRVAKKMEESGPHIDAMMGMTDVRLTTVKLATCDGSLIELLHFHSHPGRPVWEGSPCSTGFTHVALTVDDLDSAYVKLAEAGVSFNAPPQRSPDGYAKVAYGRGPEGILLEFVEVLS